MRSLVTVHRWLGIGLCLFFAMWFASGLVMMYVPFPALPESGRLAYLAPIDTAAIRVAPFDAAAQCGPEQLAGLRLLSVAERPAYVCHFNNAPVAVIFADDGTLPSSDEVVAPGLQGPFDYDQWVVHQRFDPYRPFYRHDLNDDAGTQLYVSGRTGEILQRTTSQQRSWNYLGAVVHWIYPTVLRKNWALWDQTVWWLSLAGMVGVLIGLYLGVKALLRARKSGRECISPYRAWMRWHHIFGLFSGLFVLSWIFSGWLSMDHGRLFSVPDPATDQVAAFRGGSLGEIAAQVPVGNLQAVSGAREISFHALANQAIVAVKEDTGVITQPPITEPLLREAAGMAWPGYEIAALSVVAEDDIYTSLREGSLPEGSLRITLADESDTWIHVDPGNGEILSLIDRSRRAYRWLYNGLHSLDFPGLVDNRLLWLTVMTALLGLGLTFSITGIVISARYLLR